MRDHIPVIGSPGRRPLVPTAWLSPLHSCPVQTHQATTAAELRRGRRQGDVDTYRSRPLLARHAFRTTRAERSVEQILRWKRNEFPQTVSACSLKRGKLRSTLHSPLSLWPYTDIPYTAGCTAPAQQWMFRQCAGTGDCLVKRAPFRSQGGTSRLTRCLRCGRKADLRTEIR